MAKRHIIIGAAAAGIGTAHKIRMLDLHAEVVVISDELEDPYNKCLLADYLAQQKTATDVQLTTVQALREKNITPLFGVRVVALDVTQKTVTLSDGRSLEYDTLCIATGCSPRMITVPGLARQKNVFTFYSLADINHLESYLKLHTPKHAVIVGAGLSGLECADTLNARGIKVTVIEKSNHVLPRQIDEQAARCIEQHMQHAGVKFIAQDQVTAVDSLADRVSQVHLAGGTVVPTDLLICAIGLRPNSDLAQQAGIMVQEGSIVTDRFLKTSTPWVYAAGDVALVRAYQSDKLLRSATWPDAMLQGMIAAHGMAGIVREYPGVIPITSSAFFGIKFAACMPINTNNSTHHVVNHEDSSYQKLILAENKLVGFVQVGATLTLNQLKRAVLTGQVIEDPQALFVP